MLGSSRGPVGSYVEVLDLPLGLLLGFCREVYPPSPPLGPRSEPGGRHPLIL